MENKRTALDFYRFDGEGGSGLGAEASAFASEIGLNEYANHEQKKPEVKSGEKQTVVYGKDPEDEAKAGQVGSDEPSVGDSPEEQWAALIGKGGPFHDLYGQAVSTAIQNRFRNQADLQGQVNQIAEDLSPLFLNYGLEAGDFEGLSKAVANDDAFFQAGAEKAGLDIDQYKENLKLQAEAERGRKITEAYEREQARQAMYAQWEADADILKTSFPNFDLGLEIESNPKFADLLNSGIDVRTAFLSAHAEEIFNGQAAEAEARATANVVNAIQSRASRPMESGAKHSAAIVRKADPSALSNEDMDEIITRALNGDSFSF